MNQNPLGKKTDYKSEYDPGLLFSIPRQTQRENNNISNIYFKGYDVWNAYEFSWLDLNGKPIVKILQVIYNSDSPNIVESKSLKLYLNSFSMTKFNNETEVLNIIKNDLSKIINSLNIYLKFINKNIKIKTISEKKLLDNQEIKVNIYEPDISILKIKKNSNAKTIERYTDLFRSNCPITNQPDWATLYIRYKSKHTLTDESLLRYIISYRNHSDYHESCCEKIFHELYSLLLPEILIVSCFFTRRGGIDINPTRFYGINKLKTSSLRYWRQ